jgi:hypothetical protein
MVDGKGISDKVFKGMELNQIILVSSFIKKNTIFLV